MTGEAIETPERPVRLVMDFVSEEEMRHWVDVAQRAGALPPTLVTLRISREEEDRIPADRRFAIGDRYVT